MSNKDKKQVDRGLSKVNVGENVLKMFIKGWQEGNTRGF